jgi:hypothetical protein
MLLCPIQTGLNFLNDVFYKHFVSNRGLTKVAMYILYIVIDVIPLGDNMVHDRYAICDD